MLHATKQNKTKKRQTGSTVLQCARSFRFKPCLHQAMA